MSFLPSNTRVDFAPVWVYLALHVTLFPTPDPCKRAAKSKFELFSGAPTYISSLNGVNGTNCRLLWETEGHTVPSMIGLLCVPAWNKKRISVLGFGRLCCVL